MIQIICSLGFETIGILPDKKGICEDFLDCVYKTFENRYEAKLAFKKTHPFLRDNFNSCKTRLLNLYSKLKKLSRTFKMV